jgi:Domain of unknown function (DUF4281)
MTPSIVFQILNTAILPVWVLMIVAPRWKATHLLINSYLVPLLLAVAYFAIVVTNLGAILGADFGSLEGIKKLFKGALDNEWFLSAAWFHYLAFDMFVGTWILNDSQKHNIHHAFIIPCLFFTLMLGPVGFLLYYIIRLLYPKKSNQ